MEKACRLRGEKWALYSDLGRGERGAAVGRGKGQAEGEVGADRLRQKRGAGTGGTRSGGDTQRKWARKRHLPGSPRAPPRTFRTAIQ